MMKTTCLSIAIFLTITSGALPTAAQGISLNLEDTLSIKQLPRLADDIAAAAGTVLPPDLVQASDGDFDNYVRIAWPAKQAGTYYKVFRYPAGQPGERKEISNGWKKSNWMIDHSNVIPGRKYLYSVIAAISEQQFSRPSVQDTGFARLNSPVASAHADSTPGVIPSAADSTGLFLDSIAFKITNLDRDPAKAGDSVRVAYLLSNKSTKSIDSLEMRIYLSENQVLDQDDKALLLKSQWVENISPAMQGRKSVRVALPDSLPTRVYHLFIVHSLDGKTWSSKAVSHAIRVKGK